MIKYLNYLILIIITTCSVSFADPPQTVKHIIDGDTIVLGGNKTVRYIGIDSPEIDHKNRTAAPFGFEAKKINTTFVCGKTIRIEYDTEKKDHYGRLLAYVYTMDGTFINEEMLKQGVAWSLFTRPNTKYHTKLLMAQQYAMSKKLGMWKNWKEKGDGKYIGNQKSRRFHLSNCPYGKNITSANQIQFNKKWDAFFAGFSPCKKCAP